MVGASAGAVATVAVIVVVAAHVLASGAGCGGLAGDVGLRADLRVAGAQFVPGDLDAASPAGGPPVISVFNSLTAVQPGERDKPLTGALGTTASAVALSLRGDRGYWIVVAGPPALDAPDLPTFQATLSFSFDLPIGGLTLVARAVDAAGRFGDATVVPLHSAPAPPPDGVLVVSLDWDTEADLDLHLIVPGGVEVWAHNINSFEGPLPGAVVDAAAWMEGGILDFDSNAGCVIDGRRRENIVWQATPPPGTYVVRVDTASLCGAPAARWNVRVLAAGASIAAAQGISLPGDPRFSKGAGSGVRALTFDVPAP
jgi:hypothetical protein